jgi:hypothetical protein
MAHTNAYIMYRQFHSSVSHHEFFLLLAEQLLQHGLMGAPARGGLRSRRSISVSSSTGSSCQSGSDLDNESDSCASKSVSSACLGKTCIPGEFEKKKLPPPVPLLPSCWDLLYGAREQC